MNKDVFLSNMDLDGAAVLISLLFIGCAVTIKDMRSRENRLLVVIVFNGLACAVFDLLSTLSHYPDVHFSRTALEFFAYGYLVLHNLVPAMFYIYVTMVTGISERRPLRVYALLMSPLALVMLLFLLNPMTGCLFYFDAANEYFRGPWMPCLYFAALYFAGLFTIHVIRYSRAISRKRIVMILLFQVVAASAVVVQFFFMGFKIELFSQACVYLGILLTIDDESAVYDREIGAYNRHALTIDLKRLIGSDSQFAVLLIRLCNLHSYSYLLGYETIESQLHTLSAWLGEQVGQRNVYCYGQAKYALVIRTDSREQADAMTARVRERFEHPWESEGFSAVFTVRLIELMVPQDVNRVEQILMMDEDTLMDINASPLIRGEAVKSIQRTFQVEQAIHRALSENTLEVYFQPIYDTTTRSFHSCEALVRMKDPELGAVPPDEFIRVAERNGTVVQIGEQVFEKTCAFAAENRVWELGLHLIEVNLSPVQCMKKNLVECFSRILERHHLPASMFSLEITETAAVQNIGMFRRMEDILRGMGFETSIDDFGTGYSNMSEIFNMDFEMIKIDREILWNAEKSERGRLIHMNAVALCHNMQRTVVQEGVETAAQLQMLEALGVRYCQGFYFSRPIPEQEFLEFLREHSRGVAV